MDKILKPQIFETFSSSSNTVKDWRHWLATFENFLINIEHYALDWQTVLRNFSVYVNLCPDYESATSKLQQLYGKSKNEIHARYILSTCRQKPREALDEYLLNLGHLSEDCNYSAVKNTIEAIGDAFINWLLSINIRQWLLENVTQDLTTAFDQARALEQA